MICIIIILLLHFIIIEGLIIYNANLKEEINGDYLIILGAQLNGTELSNSLLFRLKKGLKCLEQDACLKVILSGGTGTRGKVAEAEVMKRYLIQHGIAEDRMIIEDKSTNTYENMKFTKEILKKIDGRENLSLIIVTGGFHLFRAKLLARRQGFAACGVAAETPKGVLIKCYIREYFGVIKSFIFDR